MGARRATLLLTLILLALAASGCGRRPWNVLLVTLDTTRADFIGCYGKETARTPHLDRLAAEGFLFERAYASNPVTQPSHSTILTGVYPMVHGVRDNTFFQLPDERRTLAERLADEGYATAAAVGGFPLTREFGTAQGFDFYDDDLTAIRRDHRGRPVAPRFPTWYDERPAGHVNDAIRPWLRERDGEPFFVWLHYWDPHEPHIAPPPYGQIFAHDPYQGEIAYADENLGALFHDLEELGELERTLIVVTADHGEGRMEHDEMTHAFLAYDTTLWVPLIVKLPGAAAAGRRIGERVGTVDIVPTVLDLLGLEVADELQGRSLAPLMLDGRDDPRNGRPYYSESISPRLSHGFGELRALYWGPWKYIYGPRPELFDLQEDPAELHDLAAERSDERERMETALRRFLAEHESAAAADAAFEADEETRRRLAALGYLSLDDDSPKVVAEELRSDGIPPQDRVLHVNLQFRLRREINAGQYRLARDTALKLLEEAPDHPYYRAALASAYLGLGETAEAVKVVEETEAISPANVGQFLGVARALFDAGDQARALALARWVVEAGETALARLALARMLLEAGDGEAFRAEAGRALEIDPALYGARLELARHLLDEGERRRAEEEILRLLADHPIDVEAQLLHARLLRGDGRIDEALARVERALRFAPLYCEALVERLSLLVESGQEEAAAEAARELRDPCRADEDALERAAALIEGRA